MSRPAEVPPDGEEDRPEIHGVEVDDRGRCAHWQGPRDVVAIRLACCDTWYACHDCHEAQADHPPRRWPRDRFDVMAVMCGKCGQRLSIERYLKTPGCPGCGHPFNPRCALHHPRYFEV